MNAWLGEQRISLEDLRPVGVTTVLAILNGMAVLSLSSETWRDLGLTLLSVSMLGLLLVVLRNDASAVVMSGVGFSFVIQARFEIYGFSVAILELVVLCAVLFYLCVDPVVSRSSTTGYEVFLYAFLVFRVSTIPWSSAQRHAFSDLRDWLWPVLLFVVLSRALVDERAWRFARTSFVCGAVLSALYGVGQAQLGLPAPLINDSAMHKTFIDFDRMEFHRVAPAVGLQEHPSSFAIYLVIAIVLVSDGFGRRQRMRRMIGSCAIVVVLLAGLYFTYTKTAYAGIALSLIAVPAVRYWKLSLTKTAFLILIIAGIVVSGIHHLEQRGDEEILATFYARQLAWSESLNTLRNPGVLLFGNGLETVQLRTGLHPHNAALYMLVGYGVAGTALMAGALMVFLRRLVARSRTYWTRGSLALPRAMTMLILYLSVTSFFESIVLGVHERTMLAFLGALLITWPDVSALPAAAEPEGADDGPAVSLPHRRSWEPGIP